MLWVYQAGPAWAAPCYVTQAQHCMTITDWARALSLSLSLSRQMKELHLTRSFLSTFND